MEAIRWFKNKDPIEYDINVATLYDALTRSMHSSWWEWLDGIRFFFYHWPSLWMKEARYGAREFHIYLPPPKLRLYYPPIKKEWIQQLDIEKFRSLTRKRYLESIKGFTKVTIRRHPVLKILIDIRVVWNCTGNGVNT